MASKSIARHQDTPVWEWAIAGLGVLLVSAALVVLLVRAVSEEGSPPALHVSVDSITSTAAGHVVTFSVANTGSQTAGAVVIEGKLLLNGKVVEESAATLTYVPSNSKREAGMLFSADPSNHKLELKAKGFEKP